jgi:hypothetical protein
MEQKNIDIFIEKFKNKLTFSNVIKIIFITFIFYIFLLFIMNNVNIDKIEIKNKNNLVDFEKEYKLPEKNLRGRSMTNLENKK